MNIIKNTLNIGVETPFTFLVVSDIHLSEADESETEERRAFAAARKRDFSHAPDFLGEVKAYAKETGYPLFNTGDMLDFITPANIRIARAFAEETGMVMAAGNHEYWHCPKNRFSFDDVPETYEKKNESLAAVEAGLGMDIRFSCRDMGGVNFVCMDDGDYDIDEDIFEKFKAVVAEGKPILLFVHIPLYSRHIPEGDQKYTLCAPEKFFEGCHPVDVFERRPEPATPAMVAYIRNCPLVKCVFSGHTHHNAEVLGMGEMDQIITGLETIREITVK
jgi:predicted MPP superfamily phosphohydrolase